MIRLYRKTRICIIYLSVTTIFFILGWFLGLESSTLNLISTLHDWQELVGAFIGASVGVATPLILYIAQEKNIRNKKRKDLLFLLEKNIVSAINNLSGIDKMLHNFISGNLQRFKSSILADQKEQRLALGQTFIPLSYAFVFEKNLLNETTDSNYLENLILDTISISQELPTLLEDISRQFDRIINLNVEIGLLKLNDTTTHNNILLTNLDEFEKFINEQVFKHNVPVYLKKLVRTRVALSTMSNWGLKKWRREFNHLKYTSPEYAEEKIDEFFKNQVNLEISQTQNIFISKLLLVGEKSPF